MIEYQQVIKNLKKKGYSEQKNIADYWFSNREKCKRVIDDKFPNYSQIFDLQVRWRSPLGEACVEALKTHIEQLQTQVRLEKSRRYRLGDYTPIFTRIDLNDFSFDFNGEKYSIKQVVKIFPTSQIEGWRDLRGIPLDGISLTDCILIDLNFSNASFIGAKFQQVQLINCNFISANFDNSRFVAVRYEQNTALGGISLRGAIMNAVELNDQVVSSPMEFEELGYFELIKYLLERLTGKELPLKSRTKWTRFQMVDVRGINDPVLKYQAEYIRWHQSLLNKIDIFYKLSIDEQTSFILSIVLTKYWRSAKVLATFCVIINLVFTILYMAFFSHFKGLSGEFLESFYFSVVTFTTLGYGDVTPIDNLGRIIVILEVAIGYVALGSYLFILGQKVSQRY